MKLIPLVFVMCIVVTPCSNEHYKTASTFSLIDIQPAQDYQVLVVSPGARIMLNCTAFAARNIGLYFSPHRVEGWTDSNLKRAGDRMFVDGWTDISMSENVKRVGKRVFVVRIPDADMSGKFACLYKDIKEGQSNMRVESEVHVNEATNIRNTHIKTSTPQQCKEPLSEDCGSERYLMSEASKWITNHTNLISVAVIHAADYCLVRTGYFYRELAETLSGLMSIDHSVFLDWLGLCLYDVNEYVAEFTMEAVTAVASAAFRGDSFFFTCLDNPGPAMVFLFLFCIGAALIYVLDEVVYQRMARWKRAMKKHPALNPRGGLMYRNTTAAIESALNIAAAIESQYIDICNCEFCRPSLEKSKYIDICDCEFCRPSSEKTKYIDICNCELCLPTL
ncbi:uncharacterized protein LOC5519383 isoform X2 [Nematostella vectensis]|uniref:uncharacterized protein LOC5519383 isoform X2 n=1 Tax=Nematostella vectensis TaxID=45351 RepID=UPI002076EDC4|nr:uncharacterized protein LOC5519383 isoform X2 [Nematostella vectensis]